KSLNSDDRNWDHPDAIDWIDAKIAIKSILEGKKTIVYEYDYENHCRSNKEIVFENVELLVLEGILSLHDEEIRNLADIKIFVETSFDECLCRRIERDIVARGRTVESIIKQWRTTVRPMYDEFVLNLKKHAHFVVRWDETSMNLINLIKRMFYEHD
ncbi:MAG: hypothetical protein ACRC4L_03025, partial [Mycoplasma sp.]